MHIKKESVLFRIQNFKLFHSGFHELFRIIEDVEDCSVDFFLHGDRKITYNGGKRSLAAFGLPHLKIVDILPTNLPAIESNELRLDNLFVLDDGSVAIIDYESVFKKENFVKYLNYIARVIKRYAGNKQLDILVSIKVIIIYTADVEWAEEIYDLGGLRLVIEPAYLVNFDTNMVYQRLNEKIGRKERLSEEELMELMILPLTVKGKEEKQKVIVATVNMAKKLEDGRQMIRALAGILTFTDKIIDKNYRDKIKEEMRMTQIAQMFIEEGIEEGREDKAYRVARNMYNRGFTALEASSLLEEKLETVAEWYKEWDIK